MTDKKRAEAYRITAEYFDKRDYGTMAARLRLEANDIDPPYKLDRSLRGWVLVTQPSVGTYVWDAYEFGIVDSSQSLTWKDVEDRHWKVTPLRVLQPDEVAVTIPPVSDWPDESYCARVSLLFESSTGRTLKETLQYYFDRKGAERIKGI